jgi:hypothetical protein
MKKEGLSQIQIFDDHSSRTFDSRAKKEKELVKMRNLVCLGRTRQIIISRQSEDLPVSAIAPIPSSEDAFFVAHGPIATNSKIEVLRVEVFNALQVLLV